MRDREEQIEKAHARTFEWLLSQTNGDGHTTCSSPFVRWLQQSEPAFWINGKAGSGKSTLMKYLYHDPRVRQYLGDWASGGNLVIAGFFFFERGGSMLQKSSEGLIRAVLHQVLSQRPELISTVFGSSLTKHSMGRDSYELKEWTWSELKTAFHLLLTRKPATLKLFLFVDGLDEYRMLDQLDPSDRDGQGDNGDSTRAETIARGHSEIASLFRHAAQSPAVKLCLSSRPLLVFIDAFGTFPHLKLEQLTKQDISIYVDDRLGSNERLATLTIEEPELRAKLIREVVSKASGVFLWVRLVVDILLRGLQDRDRIKDLQEKLKTIPGELGGRDGLYMRMLKDISPQNRYQGFRLFQIVLHARHNLTALVLSFAEEEDTNVAIQLPIKKLSPSDAANRAQDMEGRLKSRCAGLLETQRRTTTTWNRGSTLPSPHINHEPVVQFLHQTAKEFIEQPDNWTLLLPPDLKMVPDVNVSLLSACLLRLKLIGITSDSGDLWGAIKDAIYYAAHAEKSLGVSQLELLDALDQTVTSFWDSYESTRCAQYNFDVVGYKIRRLHWANQEPRTSLGKDLRWESDFMSMAVQGSLTFYLRDKINHTGYKVSQKPGRPLLKYAVVPKHALTYSHFNRDDFGIEQADPCTTQLLLDHQANPNEVFHRSEFYNNPSQCSAWEGSLVWGFDQRLQSRSFNVSRWCENTKLLLSYGADPDVAVRYKPSHHINRHDFPISSALYIMISVLWRYPQYLDEITRIMVQKRARLLPGEKGKLFAELQDDGSPRETIATFLQGLHEESRTPASSSLRVMPSHRNRRSLRSLRRLVLFFHKRKAEHPSAQT